MRNGCHIHPNISPRSGVPVEVSVFLDLCVCRGGVHNDVLNFETCLPWLNGATSRFLLTVNVLGSVFLQHVRKVFLMSSIKARFQVFAGGIPLASHADSGCRKQTWSFMKICETIYIKDTSNLWLSINHSCFQYNHPYSQIITQNNCFARAETQQLCSWPTTSLARATCWASTLKRRRCTKLSKNSRFYVLDPIGIYRL